MFDCGALCVTAALSSSPAWNLEVLNAALNKSEKSVVQVFLKTQQNKLGLYVLLLTIKSWSLL